eukprot:TRINITY_DN15905_c0_g1_i1.p1 TRINITY_DN15905_c0_g1~~TRINITY_DN15905_c0_g1_i1.p1  ORF type:complete len:710 (-),score=147.67 TRINITY_DN15905_c0_g1_i1:242-2371(-)
MKVSSGPLWSLIYVVLWYLPPASATSSTSHAGGEGVDLPDSDAVSAPVEDRAVVDDRFHAGHGATHVTRLHRYDHVGLEVFLEREAEWHVMAAGQTKQDGTKDSSHRGDSHHRHHHQAHRLMRRSPRLDAAAGGGRATMHGQHGVADDTSSPEAAAAAAPGFLRLSWAQAEALREHHQVWANTLMQLGNARTITADGARGSRSSSRTAHYLARQEELMRPSQEQLSALQRFEREHTNVHSGRATTGLSSLSSQYVGPIGVGTTFAPAGCRMPMDSLLHLEAEETKKEVAADGTQVCQVADQSKVWVVFDTGSTNIWVSSDLCESGACARKGRRRYNHTKSVTFAYPQSPAQLTVEFGTGRLVGPQGVDDFHIGPFSVFQQTFGMIKTQNGSVFEDVPFEGILGLAFPSMSANKVKPFFDTVIDQKALQHNEFAFYFSRDTPTANAIFWGGVDPRFYEGHIEYFPVTDPYYWAVDLHAFHIGEECLFGPGCEEAPSLSELGASPVAGGQDNMKKAGEGGTPNGKAPRRLPTAIIDTGTTYFTAERFLFDDIMDRMPPARCDDITDQTHQPMTYTLKSAAGALRDFVFTKDMYMTQTGDGADAQCAPAFMRIDIPEKHGPAMVLGEVFLRHYFAVFDRGGGAKNDGRLGLAPSVHSEEALMALRDLTHTQPSFQADRKKALSSSLLHKATRKSRIRILENGKAQRLGRSKD